MKTLIIVDLTPIDTIKLSQYSVLAAETLLPFNGVFIAKGPIECLAGEVTQPMKAVIEFPDKQSARDWYNSAAYQAIIPLREEGMHSQFYLI
jgi:uncharacterized protein (DUF1330 family)